MRLLTTIALLCLAAFADAQNLPLESVYMDQPEALRMAGIDRVRCIFRDRAQRTWIGTENGLYRFNGTRVDYLRHRPGDSNSLPGNAVLSIAEDRNGIWIGTHNGVARLDPLRLSATPFNEANGRLPRGNFDNVVFAAPDGSVWTGNNAGLFRFDPHSQRFQPVWKQPIPGKALAEYVRCISAYKTDSLLLGTFHGLVVVHAKNFGSRRILPNGMDLLITALCKDADGQIWAGTWGQGCLLADATLSKWNVFRWEQERKDGNGNIVNGLCPFPTGGGVIAAVQGRLLQLHPAAGKGFERKLLQDTQESGNSPTYSCVWVNRDGSVWTGGTGLWHFRLGDAALRTLSEGLAGQAHRLQWSQGGGLLLSRWHGREGLVLLDTSGIIQRRIASLRPADPYGMNISGVAPAANGRYWVASLAGTCLLDSNWKEVGCLDDAADPANRPASRKVNDLLLAGDTLWLACYKKGIDLFDGQGRKLQHFSAGDGSGLQDDLVERIFRDRRGRTWICGNSALYLYDAARNRFRSFDLSPERSRCTVFDIAEAKGGKLWVATEFGLLLFDPASGEIQRIQSPLLEREEVVTAVECAPGGDPWFLTERHLAHYDQQGHVTLFGPEDGLRFLPEEILLEPSGSLLIAGDGKIVRFTKTPAPALERPLLQLDRVQVNDSSIAIGSNGPALPLAYDQNKLSFEFSLVNYTKPGQNQYAYRLEGVDSGWSYGNRGYVSYAHLEPGQYVWQVKGMTFDGRWSDEVRLAFVIRPPFWRRPLFLVACTLLLAALAGWLFRYIAQRNLREKILRLEKDQALERERNRIARDMHDELGSGLTKIAILSEVVRSRASADESARYLQQISESSRTLVDNLQDIIWVLNPRNDTVERFAAYLRHYALQFFDGTDCVLHIDFPEPLPETHLSEEQRRSLFLVVKEALNNALRHAAASRVELSLRLNSGTLRITVADNGSGFDPAQVRAFSNGLGNMRQRMEQAGGSFRLESERGKGTSVLLLLPL